jgi:hypothetical protein
LIINQRDAGDVFRIYKGRLCDNINLTRWREKHLLADYNIEKMDKSTFCQKWIAKPNKNEK